MSASALNANVGSVFLNVFFNPLQKTRVSTWFTVYLYKDHCKKHRTWLPIQALHAPIGQSALKYHKVLPSCRICEMCLWSLVVVTSAGVQFTMFFVEYLWYNSDIYIKKERWTTTTDADDDSEDDEFPYQIQSYFGSTRNTQIKHCLWLCLLVVCYWPKHMFNQRSVVNLGSFLF